MQDLREGGVCDQPPILTSHVFAVAAAKGVTALAPTPKILWKMWYKTR